MNLVHGSSRGMTLIEIMVVVFILGMIAAIVTFNVHGAQVEAEKKDAGVELANLRQALELYRMKRGRYPGTAEGLAALFEEKVLAGKLRPDPWGRPYVYVSPSGADGYDLRSLGPDGEPGGDDVTGD